MSCEQCRALKAQLNKEPDCDACLMPRVLPNNYVVLYIIKYYGIVITNGMGGMVLSEIFNVCRLESIQPTVHLVNRIITYYQELTKKDNNG
jgi:hypothetical protein